MEKIIVGFRFNPTGEELFNYYLKNKILGNSWLVDDAISEINISAYDPEYLPSLSKLKSNDPEWYFFSLKEYYAPEKKKKGVKRTTPNGFWKVTGPDMEIKDKRGHGEVIGIKKTLVYRKGRSANGVKTPWVMHEHHITSSPFNQSNYVISKIMYNYKGVDGDSLYGNKSNELSSHSTMVSVSNTATTFEVEQLGEADLYFSVDDLPNPMNEPEDLSLFNPNTIFSNNYTHQQQQQTNCNDEDINNWLTFNGGNFNNMLGDLDIMMDEHRNDHRPKKPLTGTLPDYSSDSNAESISATSYQGISSPDSAHNSSRHFHNSVDEIPALRKDSCKDTQPHAETSTNRKNRKSHFTRRTVASEQEVKAVDASMEKKKSSSSSMVKKEKKGWFITEESMDRRNRKNPRYIHLMNMIIGLIFLVAVIGNIISFLLSVKT